MFSKFSHAPPTPVFDTVSIGILAAARLVDANLVECGVKILISIPADCRVVSIHLAKMCCEAILQAFVVAMKRRVMLPSRFAVNFHTCYDINSLIFLISWKFCLSNVEFLIWCFHYVTNAVTRKFCSNDKLYISMCLNISLGLCPQSIAVSFKFLL